MNPNWARSRWNPPPGVLAMPPYWLTSLSAGICAGAIGVAILGYGWLTEHIVWGIVAACAVGLVLFVVSTQHGRRQAEAARAIRTALLEYVDRHDGWFPRGEASPAASLSLLHRENPALVTAAVLGGQTVPEDTVRARLEVGELLTPETCGWHYVEGLRRDDDPRLALFWAKVGAGFNALMSGDAHFVFFVGGGVEYVPADRWEEFCASQEQAACGARAGAIFSERAL